MSTTWFNNMDVMNLRRGLSVTTVLCAMLLASTVVLAQTVKSNLWVTNGSVRALAKSGRTVYLGGDFTYVGPSTGTGVLLNATSGLYDPLFPKVNGDILAVAPDGAGGWYIGGSFTVVGGLARNRIAHILSNLSVDSWNPNADGRVTALAVHGGNVYAGGDFLNIGGQPRSRIAALRIATGLANTWNPGASATVYTFAPWFNQIFVGGDFTTIGGQARNFIAVFDTNTSTPATFGVGTDGPVYAIAINGIDVFVGGSFVTAGGRTRNNLASFNFAGGVQGFTPSPNGVVRALKVLASRVYVGGDFTTISGVPRNRAASIDTSNAVASGWNPNVDGTVNAMFILGSNVYVGGSFGTVGGQTRNNIARIDTAGVLSSWNPNAASKVIAVTALGTTVFAGGAFGSVNGVARNGLAAIDDSLGTPTAWNPNVLGTVHSLVLSGSTLYVGGSFTTVGTQGRTNLAAVSTATGNPTTWNPVVNGSVLTLALSAGRVYAGGSFSTIGSFPRSNIAVIDSATGLPLAWNPGADSPVLALRISGPTVYAGGLFSTIGSQLRNRIAAVDISTGNATAWNPNAGAVQGTYVNALAVSRGIVYVGGRFTNIGTQARTALAALDSISGVSTSFNSNLEPLAIVNSIAPAGQNLYVGGLANGGFGPTTPLLVTSDLFSVDAATGAATAWDPKVSGGVDAVAVSDSSVYAGGAFTNILNEYRTGFAGVVDAALAVPVIDVNPSSLNFLNVLLGQSKTDSVVVTNTGITPLIISSATSNNPRMTVTPAGSVTIPPGGNRKYYVTFSPNALGNQNATITLAHNATGGLTTFTAAGVGIAPVFSVLPGSINFGNVRINSSKQDSLTVTNTGTASLNITLVSSTNARFSVTPTSAVINPSSSRRFYVTFSPNAIGNVGGNITFTHDAAGSPSTVAVAGTGIEPLFSVAPTNVGFGNVVVATGKSDSVLVGNSGNTDLTITSITSSNAQFVVQPSTGVIPGGGSARFRITFTPTAAGTVAGNIIFNHNATSTPDTVTVNGVGVVPGFTVVPNSLNFGNVLVNTARQDSVTVTNTGTSVLNISLVSSSNGRFSVTPGIAVINPAASRKFYVTFNPNALGNFGGNITFTHDAPGSPSSVPVAGIGVAPSFAVAPSTLGFGNVVVSTNRVDSVTVTNAGGANLAITSILSTSNQFTIQPTSGVVAAGDSSRFRITFTPTSSGLKSGDIIFNHDATTTPDTVLVSGSGITSGFSVAPSSLTFGNVTVNSTKLDSVTVTNTGGALLTILSATPTNNRYTVNPTSATVPPLGTRKFFVSFSPNAVGPFNGSIVFAHDAPGSPSSVSVAGSGVAAGFVLNSGSLAFGNVRVGTTKQDSVTVSNTGSATLTIASAVPTNARFSVSPSNAVILPGSSRTFFVNFSPQASGIVNGAIRFTYDATGSPTDLTVSGNGTAPGFSVSPRNMDFGNVVVNSTSMDSVLVTNAGSAALVVASVTTSNGRFVVTPTASVIAAGLGQWFAIRFTPDAVGAASANIVFIHDAAVTPDTVRAVGSGVNSTFVVSPLSLAFNTVRVGENKRDSIRVSNTGGSPIFVSSITSNNSRFQVSPTSLDIPVGGNANVFVTFVPIVHGAVSGGVTFIHTAAGSPTTIVVGGTGLSAAISVSRQNINFSSVRVNRTQQDTVSVHNPGNDTLRITNAVMTNSRFGVQPSAAVVDPGASTFFTISFTPNALGDAASDLRLTHNAPGSPTAVQTFGTGIAPLVFSSPHSLSFGEIALGSSTNRTMKLYNVGSANLVLDSLRVRGRDGAEFAIIGSTGPFLPLTPGDSLSVTVRFSPVTVDSAKRASLLVFSDAFNGNDSVSLQGRSRGSIVAVTLTGDTAAGRPLDVIVQPPVNFVVEQARLFYRKAGRKVFDSLALAQAGQTYTVRFPDSVVTLRGIEYYVALINLEERLTNPEINPITNPSTLQVRVLSAPTPQVLQPRKYRMISVPLELTLTTVQSQLFDDYGSYAPNRWRLFRWEEDRNVEFDSISATLTPGKAFWLTTQTGSSFDADNGRSVRSNRPWELPLFPGWNQIASPFAFAVSWDSIENSRFVRPPFFWDGNQYMPNVRLMQPWEGYFVLNDSSEIITLSVPPTESVIHLDRMNPPRLTGASDCVVQLSAVALGSSSKDEFNYVGFREGSSVARDLLDLPEPPAIENSISLYFDEGGERYLANFKPMNSDGQKWHMRIHAGISGAVRVSLSQQGQLPPDFKIYVFDEDQFTIVTLTENRFVCNIGTANVDRSYRIVIGTEAFAERERDGIPLVPVDFALGQNYPNPFNPSTTIRYSLGKRSFVSLEIYSPLGQLVCTLVAREQTTGSYTAVWDGTNSSGTAVASGVYLYRLRAGEFVSSKKLLLLR